MVLEEDDGGGKQGLCQEKVNIAITDKSEKDFSRPPDGATEPKQETIIRPSLKRYVILMLFCISSGNKAFQWIQLPASQEKLTFYYDVDNYVINACSVIFMLSFVFLSWPACYIIRRMGIRRAVLLASFGAALGSTLKCFSCHESGIKLLIVSQILVSGSEQLIFSIPSRLASVWFPDHEVSSALSLSVLGQQVGVALGFLVPQVFLASTETKEEIGHGLQGIFLTTAAISVAAFLATLCLFDEAPKHAPGAARLKQLKKEACESEKRRALALEGATSGWQNFKTEMGDLFGQMLRLMADRHLCALALSYGINQGVCYTIQSLIDQLLGPLWPHDGLVVGNTGFLVIICGALCSPLWGRLMDKLHRYLTISIVIAGGNVVCCALFAYAVCATHSTLALYLSAGLFGVFQVAYLVAGLELATELTYPAPELVTSSLMNVMPQIFGSGFIFLASHIMDTYGPLAVNVFYLVLLTTAFALLLTITETLKRQNAVIEKSKQNSATLE